jgi:hypothetical protein
MKAKTSMGDPLDLKKVKVLYFAAKALLFEQNRSQSCSTVIVVPLLLTSRRRS